MVRRKDLGSFPSIKCIGKIIQSILKYNLSLRLRVCMRVVCDENAYTTTNKNAHTFKKTTYNNSCSASLLVSYPIMSNKDSTMLSWFSSASSLGLSSTQSSMNAVVFVDLHLKYTYTTFNTTSASSHTLTHRDSSYYLFEIRK